MQLLTTLLFATLATTALADTPRGLIYYRPVERGEPKTLEFDVAIYGGTPGGFAAATQAARLGKNVVLVSFDPYIGGLTSGGLTATDVGRQTAIGGMAMEFYERVGQLRDFSPSKAEATFRAMLDEAEVTVLLERPLESVQMTDNRITSITFETGETIQARVFIDTTYEGDLMAAANVSYHVGREPAAHYGEFLGGQWQDVTWHSVYQFCDLPICPFKIE